MGYTHYWERLTALPPGLFAKASKECQRLGAALNIPLGNAAGEGAPAFSHSEICFNGHVDSGRLMSVPRAQGLVWPDAKAHGVAVLGKAPAAVGDGGAGPMAGARVLGPRGNGSYETFLVRRVHLPEHAGDPPTGGWWYEFCKTNYRPYDLCVQGCLIILSHHLGSRRFRVTSDGKSPEWNEARDACQHVLGYGIDWGEGELALPAAE